MTKEKIQEYTLRITQANSTQLTIILYDMTLTYLTDANQYFAMGNRTEYTNQMKMAIKCIEEMQKNLHYEYELAIILKRIYLSMKKTLRIAYLTMDNHEVEQVIKNLTSLKEAYQEIEKQDTTSPIMENAQTVTAGMTYGKNSLTEELTDKSSNRGFLV